MAVEIITAIVAFVGILLGAGVQYLFSQRTESAKHFQGLRTKSYVDFINSTARITLAQKNQAPDDENDAFVLMTDAKARIAIYGSPEVVRLVAEFFRRHGAVISQDACASFVAIVSAMRADTPCGKTAIPNRDIGQLILDKDVS